MQRKRGQFYLLAAIVIIVLILGYAGVSNYINKRNATKVYDVKEELNIEGKDVLEFGVLRSDDITLTTISGENITGENAIIQHFITLYTIYLESVGENINLYYIFGNGNTIKAYKIADVEIGSLTLNIEGAASTNNIIKKSVQELSQSEYAVDNQKVNVTINGNNYPFDLKEGENFYFIVSQTVGGEQYVETN